MSDTQPSGWTGVPQMEIWGNGVSVRSKRLLASVISRSITFALSVHYILLHLVDREQLC